MCLSLLAYKWRPDFCLRSATQKFWIINLLSSVSTTIVIKRFKVHQFPQTFLQSLTYSIMHIRRNLDSLILGTHGRWLRYVRSLEQEKISAVTELILCDSRGNTSGMGSHPGCQAGVGVLKNRSWRYPLDADPLIEWDNWDCYVFQLFW